MKKEATIGQKAVIATLVGFLLFVPLMVGLKSSDNVMFSGSIGLRCDWVRSVSDTFTTVLSSSQLIGYSETWLDENWYDGNVDAYCHGQCLGALEEELTSQCQQLVPPFSCEGKCRPHSNVDCTMTDFQVGSSHPGRIDYENHVVWCDCGGWSMTMEGSAIYGCSGVSSEQAPFPSTYK